MLLEEQAKGLFRTQLGDTGKILHPKAIQDLGTLQPAFAQAQRALDGIGPGIPPSIVCSDSLQQGGREGEVGQRIPLLLLVPADQETSVGGIDRDQLAMFVADRVETFAGPSNDVVMLVPN